jgi:hypothetical protein
MLLDIFRGHATMRSAMLQQVFGWLDGEYDKIPVERAILRDSPLP